MRGISRAAGIAFVFTVAFAAGQVTDTNRIGVEADAIGGINTLELMPAHGRGAAVFVVAYQVTPCVAGPPVSIEFSWNGLPPGAGQVLGTATLGSNCRASLAATPPLNPTTHAAPGPGAYFVYGFVPLPTGGATIGTEASATYVVDVTPTATSTGAPTATARSSASARPTASAVPSGSPALSPAASSVPSGRPNASAATSARTSSASVPTVPLTLTWWRSVGGLLLLGGVSLGLLLFALLTLLIVDRVEQSRARSARDRALDKAA